MSVSAAPLPMYSDPDRLVPSLPSERAEPGSTNLQMFGAEDGEPSFWDFVDVINPLQHLPVISTLYRDITGDKIGVGARLVGGALFGGVLGLGAATANCLLEESSGRDLGGHALAMLRGDESDSMKKDGATQLAAATPPALPQNTEEVEASLAQDQTFAASEEPPLPQPAMQFSASGPVAHAPPSIPMENQVAVLTSGAAPRFRPVLGRGVSSPKDAPPAISVPVSNGNMRSNVPITGRNPVAAYHSGPVASSPIGAAPLPSAAALEHAGNGPDWFTAAWGQAMDKYENGKRLGAPPPAQTSDESVSLEG